MDDMGKHILEECSYTLCAGKELQAANEKLKMALGLARKIILSGERMSPQAEKVFEQVLEGE